MTTQTQKHELHEVEERLLGELRALRRGLRTSGAPGKPLDRLTIGQKIADQVAATMGSWKFMIIQTTLLFVWIVLNITAYVYRWDPYRYDNP